MFADSPNARRCARFTGGLTPFTVCVTPVVVLALLSNLSAWMEPQPDRPAASAAQDATGRLIGQIRFEGDVPRLKVPDDVGRLRPLLEVHAERGGLRHVAVFVEPLSGAQNDAPPPEAEAGKTPAQLPPAVMDQKDHTFRPHVLTVRAGQRVRFTNSDAANHNVRAAALAAKNTFNTFTPADGSYTHRFELDRKYRPIRLGCDIHPWMQAWIYVFDHPWHTVTDGDGKFAIPQLPPGKYRVSLRQPDGGFRTDREITIEAGKTAVFDHTYGSADFAD